jgi:hypothetical protein
MKQAGKISVFPACISLKKIVESVPEVLPFLRLNVPQVASVAAVLPLLKVQSIKCPLFIETIFFLFTLFSPAMLIVKPPFSRKKLLFRLISVYYLLFSIAVTCGIKYG